MPSSAPSRGRLPTTFRGECAGSALASGIQIRRRGNRRTDIPRGMYDALARKRRTNIPRGMCDARNATGRDAGIVESPQRLSTRIREDPKIVGNRCSGAEVKQPGNRVHAISGRFEQLAPLAPGVEFRRFEQLAPLVPGVDFRTLRATRATRPRARRCGSRLESAGRRGRRACPHPPRSRRAAGSAFRRPWRGIPGGTR
jgi:hypothetical protein